MLGAHSFYSLTFSEREQFELRFAFINPTIFREYQALQEASQKISSFSMDLNLGESEIFSHPYKQEELITESSSITRILRLLEL